MRRKRRGVLMGDVYQIIDNSAPCRRIICCRPLSLIIFTQFGANGARDCTVHCILSTVLCILSTVHCILSTVRCILRTYTFQRIQILHSALSSLHCCLHILLDYIIQRMYDAKKLIKLFYFLCSETFLCSCGSFLSASK